MYRDARHSSQYLIHPSHSRLGFLPFPDRLYVIAAITNPSRWVSRYELYRAFEKRVEDAGAILYTIEVAFGGREFEITEANNPRHIQMRAYTEIWMKECMINADIARLPASWRYVAWIDADVQFSRADWAQETIHQLQHYKVVQMFSHAQDLGPHGEPIMRPEDGSMRSLSLAGTYQSFMYSHVNGVPPMKAGAYYGGGAWPSKPLAYWHPGFAWAARREAVEQLGGLFDIGIAGNGDHHMANALVGRAADTLPKKIGSSYRSALMEWQSRADRYIQRNVGYVDGFLLHHWHGKKKDRKYVDRWQLLIEENFDPNYDIKRDSQGLWQLTERNWRLRDKLRNYMKMRLEDSIDL